MQLAAVRNLLGENSAHAKGIINELSQDLRQAMGDIRGLVYDLRPPMLDELGLVAAIRSLDVVESPLRLEVNAPQNMQTLSAAAEVAVFRIVNEALQNARLHGEANTCVVSLTVNSGQLTLNIVDNGNGMDADITPGVGLESMKERAAELGGTFTIHSTPGSGTRIEVNLPLER